MAATQNTNVFVLRRASAGAFRNIVLLVVVVGVVWDLAMLTKLGGTNVHCERQASVVCTVTSTYAGVKTWTSVFDGMRDTRVDYISGDEGGYTLVALTGTDEDRLSGFLQAEEVRNRQKATLDGFLRDPSRRRMDMVFDAEEWPFARWLALVPLMGFVALLPVLERVRFVRRPDGTVAWTRLACGFWPAQRGALGERIAKCEVHKLPALVFDHRMTLTVASGEVIALPKGPMVGRECADALVAWLDASG